jgi:hypothetical protein
MCSYPCFGLSKTGFTPPSQLLKLIILKKKQKNRVAADQEIGSENCVAADAEIGSENCVINYIYIYIYIYIIFFFFWVFTTYL